MVAVVTGGGSGLVNSSKEVLGAAGELGNATTGRAGEQVTVNAANGNLVVQARDEYLVGVGPDVNLLRTYNSRGGWDGDNGDSWRMSYYRRVGGLSAPLNTVGSTIQRTAADGSQATYTYKDGRYVNTDGAGQYDTLSFDSTNGTWTWTDGDSGVKETYEAESSGNYRLSRVEDPDGNAVRVSYNASGLIETLGVYKAGASTASETVSLTYIGTALQKTTVNTAEGARSVTSYSYYPAGSGIKTGKLQTVTTDLTPANGGDNQVYTTTYDYDANGRLSSIQQTDGTLVSISYHADGRVKSVLDGRGLGTSFTYDAVGTTTVKDALGQVTTLKYGANGELLEVSGAVTGGGSFIQKYTYNANGDLLTSTNAKGETTTYEYNGAGALTRRTDAAGHVMERSYTGDGLLESETVYLSPDPDGTGSGTATLPRTTRYFYDSNGSSAVKRRLAYVLGPQGEVTRYGYNLLGQVERRVEYTGALFTAGSPSFTSLEAWVNGSQALSVERQVVDYTYDLRGQVETEKRYATVSVSGNTIALGGLSTTTYAYDPAGRLLSRQDASGVKLTYEYDGLGRVTKTLDTNNVATIYSYDDQNRKTSIQLANGQTTVQIFNAWGELVSSDVLGAGNTEANPKSLGTTNYSYDDLGRLWRTSDATGVKRYTLHDVSGRKSADIAANGQLTEYLYDPAGRLIQSIAYITPLSQAKLDALTATSKISDAGIRPAIAAGQDRITTYYYDTAGRLTGVQDADGYLTTTQYDGTGAITSQKTFANVTQVTRRDVALGTTQSSAPALPDVTEDAAKDRTVRNLYDASGRLAAQINGENALTVWTYDAAGNKLSQLRRSAALTSTEQAYPLSQLLTRNFTRNENLQGLDPLADDELTQWLYDGRGQLIAQLDAEGALTEYTYDGAGRLQDTLRYAKQAAKPIATGLVNVGPPPMDPITHMPTGPASMIYGPVCLRLVKSSGNACVSLSSIRATAGTPLKTSRTYNNRGLLETETAVDGTVTRYQYDDLQRLTRTTRAEGTAEVRVQTVGYDDWGRVNDTRLQGDATGVTTTYDAAGRRTSVTDARGHKTVYYYDAQGRQQYAILVDPTTGGEVLETIYSSFSEVSATVTHTQRLSTATANALTGGMSTETLDDQVAALSVASLDNRTDRTYNRRGLIQQAIDALGHKTDYSYNAFGQLSREVRDIDPAGTADGRRLTLDYGYNRRGELTWTERSSSALASNVVTSSVFDALGRLYQSINELNVTTTYEYTRDSGTGRTVKVTGAAGTTTTTYDALDRVLTHKDRNGNTVTTTHDAANRKLTVKTSEGFQTVTEYTRHGQTAKVTDATGATTTYAYDTHGNLLTVTDALGNVTKNSYDAGDNLVEVVQGLTAYEGGAPVNDGSATTTRYSFDAANRVLTQTVDPGGLNLITRYTYDGQGRKLKITDPRGTVTTQVFNAKGELKDVIADDVTGGLQLKTRYSYDAQSRVLSVTEGADTTAARKTAYAYDVLGRRTSETVDPDGLQLKTSYEYDKAGRLLVKRNALDQVTARYRYDNAGRLLYSVEYGGGGAGAVKRYAHDGEGRLVGQRAFSTPLAANWASLSETELSNALNSLGTAAEDQLSVNAYDRDGRLIYSVDALGQVSERKYDSAGRVVMLRQYAQAVTGVTAGMAPADIQGKIVVNDTLDHVTRHAYDKVGNLRFTINAEGYVSENRYDAAGRVVATVEHEQRWSGSSLGTVSEVTLSGTYTPTRWEFNNAAQGFTNSTNVIENGRLKLLSRPVAGSSWDSVNGARSLPVGSTLKLDIQPMQLQQDLHVILRDASGQPGRIGVILKPTGKIESQRQTASDTYIGATLGTYTPGTTYTIELESFDKGAWIYIYPKGSSRTAADCIKSRVEEPTITWQGVRTQLAVKRTLDLPGETFSYVDNLEELPPAQASRVTQYTYDAAGRARFAVDAEGYVSETRYDDQAGKTTTLRYANRISGSSAYTPAAYATQLAGFTPALLASLGNSTSTSRELDRAGRVSIETDGNGVQTRYTYDAAGRLETEVRAANIAGQASITRYKYNAAGLRSEVVRGDGTPEASTTRYVYDDLGRLSKTIDPRGVALAEGTGDWEKAERMRLGYAENLATLTPEARAAAQAALLARYTTETTYDATGRVKTVTRQVSSATSTATTPLTTSTDYDAFGNAIKLTDARGYSSHQVFDKLGRVVQSIDAENYLTTATYDAFGNLTSTLRLDAKVKGTLTAGQAVAVVTSAPGSGAYVLADAALDHLTSREYDRNNRLLRETDAEGYVEGAQGALNAFGERTSVRNKLGASVTYTYDRLGRVLTETLPVTVKVDGVDTAVVNEYQYDSRGNRITTIEAKGLAEQRTTQMRYDAANRLTHRIGMAYEALNNASSTDTSTSTVIPADSYAYDARGNLVEHISHGQLQAGGGVSGGVTGGKRSVRYYDALDRQVLQLSADRVATSSSYDQAGHLVQQTTYATRLADAVAISTSNAPAITKDAANDRTYIHRYDELGRKVETLLDKLYAWDSGLTGDNLVISGLTAQRTSLNKFFYDAAGNLTEVLNGRGYSSYSYYDGIGRKTLSLDAAGAAIAWDYGRAGNVATKETKYSGMLPGGYARQADTTTNNNSVNTPAQLLPVIEGLNSRVQADDRVTEFTLDRLDRVTEKRILGVAQDHIDASGTRTRSTATATTQYSYNGLGQVTQLSELAAKLGANETWETSNITYDGLGRETRREGVAFVDWQSDSVRPTTDVEYNGLGDATRRILRGKNPDAQVETDDRITRYSYDKNGLLTQTTDASGAVTLYGYDANGDLVRRTAKDVVRSDSTAQAPKLRDIVKRYTLDAAGRIASETTSESDKPAQAETRKTRYNAFGEVSAKGIGDGFEEFYEYSTLGKISKTNAGDGAIKFYVYDAAGNQTREIKGNGDATYKVGGQDVAIDLRTLTLEQATSGKLKPADSVFLPLYSRVSIYDTRNLVTQTIDPQIDVLKSSVSMSGLYGQAWVPAWTPPPTNSVNAIRIPAAEVSGTSGAQPRLNISSANSKDLRLRIIGIDPYKEYIGDPSGAGIFSRDISALKPYAGQPAATYEYEYSIFKEGMFVSGHEQARGFGSFSIDANGTVTINSNNSDPSAMYGAEAYFTAPKFAHYNLWGTAEDGQTWLMHSAYFLAGQKVSILPGWPNYNHPNATTTYLIRYQDTYTLEGGSYRVTVNNRTGVVGVTDPQADPTALPVNFYIKGRDVSQRAKITLNGNVTLTSGTYVPASVNTPGYTQFTIDARNLLGVGSWNYSLQALDTANNPSLDEGGNPIIQTGRIVMADDGTQPVVQSQITILNTNEKVTIKRFQAFNAFGEVSEERDERVEARMLAALNDGAFAPLSALTDAQKDAARTTLKYNVLGQLIAKLDPETYITLENGYRYRARPKTEYGYDLLGRLTTLTDANGNLSRVQYLAGSRGLDARVQREFDAAGGHADVLNVNGAGIRLSEYDVFGDSRRLTEAAGSDEERVTERSYDKRGLLETVIRKNVQRLASGNGEALDTARDLQDNYTYDQLGQRLSATNALNIKTRTDYDALGRVVQTVSGNGFVTGYQYELRVAGQADGITGLAGASSGGYVLTTTRADGRTLKDKIDYFGHTTWHQDLAGTQFTYGFNSAAQLVRQTSTRRADQSSGQDIAYSYYANGYIRTIEDRAQSILSQYAYDNAGNRVYEGIFLTTSRDPQGSLVLATGATAFQSATITYDELNRISRVKDDNFFDVRYEFDANGNRRRIVSNYWDGLAGLRATQDYWYAYDSLNRFTVSKGQLESSPGVAAAGRATSQTSTAVTIGRGLEGTLIGYDKLNQRRSAEYTYVSGTTSQTITETYGYSRDGYLQTTKQGGNLVVTRRLDDIGRTTLLTDLVNGQSTSSTYDSDNRLLTQNANGQALFYLYYGNTTDTLQSATGAGELAYVGTSTENAGMVIGSGTIYQYAYWDDAKQANISKGASINLAGSMSGAGASVTSTLQYDVNGNIKSATDYGAGITRTYTTNASGQVLRREGGNGTHDYYYADGHRIGDVGNTPDDKSRVSYAEQLARRGSTEEWQERRERYQKPRAVTSADFDQNYEPINDSYPGNAASSYTVRRNGETLRDIAQALWGDSSMWYLIAEANGMLADGSLAAGRVLVIPNKVTNIHNNSTTCRPYNAGEAIGAVDPNWDQDPRGPMEDFLLRQVHMNPDDPVSLEMWSVFKYGYQPDTSPWSGGQADGYEDPWGGAGYSYFDPAQRLQFDNDNWAKNEYESVLSKHLQGLRAPDKPDERYSLAGARLGDNGGRSAVRLGDPDGTSALAGLGNAIGESLASQSEPTVPAPVSAQERADILEMFAQDSPANSQGQGLRLGSGANGLRFSDSAVAGWNSDVDRGIRDKAQALLNFDEAVAKVSAQEDAEAAVRRQAWLKQQHAQAEAYGRQLDLAAAAKIQGLTRYSAADRLADSNYRLALESQERIARSQSFSPTGQAASRLIDPDVQQAQAMGMDVDYNARAEWLPDPRALEGTSLAAKAWRSDHEIKLGGALYLGVGGNAELTMTLNPSRLNLSATEFEWGLGVGFGANVKGGLHPLHEQAKTVTAPQWVLAKFGDGQADGTGALSFKTAIEVSAPGTNFALAEARFGVQSPLTGAPTNTPSGGFYEVKFGEYKVAPTLQLGATAKIDFFNNSYKRIKP